MTKEEDKKQMKYPLNVWYSYNKAKSMSILPIFLFTSQSSNIQYFLFVMSVTERWYQNGFYIYTHIDIPFNIKNKRVNQILCRMMLLLGLNHIYLCNPDNQGNKNKHYHFQLFLTVTQHVFIFLLLLFLHIISSFFGYSSMFWVQ